MASTRSTDTERERGNETKRKHARAVLAVAGAADGAARAAAARSGAARVVGLRSPCAQDRLEAEGASDRPDVRGPHSLVRVAARCLLAWVCVVGEGCLSFVVSKVVAFDETHARLSVFDTQGDVCFGVCFVRNSFTHRHHSSPPHLTSPRPSSSFQKAPLEDVLDCIRRSSPVLEEADMFNEYHYILARGMYPFQIRRWQSQVRNIPACFVC